MTEIPELVSAGIQFARTAERLGSVLRSTIHVREELEGVADLEPALKPEVIAALENLTAVVDACGRAMTFLDARHQALLAGTE